MKKINSIWYGSKFIGFGVFFCIISPLIMFILSKYFFPNVFSLLIKISIAIGILSIAILIFILVIELNQDNRINLQYIKTRYSKIKISNSKYECQNCGYKNVSETDSTCIVCGVSFNNFE